MSITRGIEVRHIDPAQDKPYVERPCVSWKNEFFDWWVHEWLRNRAPSCKVTDDLEEFYTCTFSQEDLLQMVDDIIHKRFYVCPRNCNWIVKDDYVENYAIRYAGHLKELAENMQENEILVYYDADNY